MLKDLLPVFDNLERAVQHAEIDPGGPGGRLGLRMVLKQFIDTLEKSGIKRIATVGQPFDPTRHEAIQQLESAEHPAGVVMAEVQPGYLMGDTLSAPRWSWCPRGPCGRSRGDWRWARERRQPQRRSPAVLAGSAAPSSAHHREAFGGDHPGPRRP